MRERHDFHPQNLWQHGSQVDLWYLVAGLDDLRVGAKQKFLAGRSEGIWIVVVDGRIPYRGRNHCLHPGKVQQGGKSNARQNLLREIFVVSADHYHFDQFIVHWCKGESSITEGNVRSYI